MTINVACGSAEVTGIAEVKDVNITFTFEAEETGAVVKQFLPAIRELKEFGIFQTQKDNDRLAEKLNTAREENRERDRELERKNDTIRKLEKQLEEARAIAKANLKDH